MSAPTQVHAGLFASTIRLGKTRPRQAMTYPLYQVGYKLRNEPGREWTETHVGVASAEYKKTGNRSPSKAIFFPLLLAGPPSHGDVGDKFKTIAGAGAVSIGTAARLAQEAMMFSTYIVGGLNRATWKAPAHGVGAQVIREVIESKVETMFQPRRLPLEWYPSTWNGQKNKDNPDEEI